MSQNHFVRPIYKPANKATAQIVSDLISKTNGKRKIPEHILTDLICGCLALRGCHFDLMQKHLVGNKEFAHDLPAYKKALTEITKSLVGSLLQRHGTYTYSIHPSLPHTLVMDKGEADLLFNCSGPYARFQKASSIPAPEFVSILNSRRAVPVILPQVGCTLDYLRHGDDLPINFGRLPEHPKPMHNEDYVHLLRNEIDLWIRKFRYLAVLLPDGNPEAISLTCVEDYAHELSDFIQTKTIRWMGKQGLPLTRFYSEIHTRDGRVVPVAAHATQQAKARSHAA